MTICFLTQLQIVTLRKAVKTAEIRWSHLNIETSEAASANPIKMAADIYIGFMAARLVSDNAKLNYVCNSTVRIKARSA